MINEIDRRLLAWAEYQLGGGCQMVGGYGSMMAAISAGGGQVIRSTVTEVYVADEVLDTEAAVDKLAKDLRKVVNYHYLNNELSIEQKASKCRLSKPTYYRRLDTAHQHVLYLLQPRKKPGTERASNTLAAIRSNQNKKTVDGGDTEVV